MTQLSLSSLDVSQNYLDFTAGGQDITDIETLTSNGCTVTYEPQKDIPVLDVTLLGSLEICPGDSYELTASIIPEDASNKKVLWSSGNTDVVTVTGGVLTAIAEGSANVTVTTQDGGYSAQCMVNVVPGELRSNKYSIYMDKLWSAMEDTSAEKLISEMNNDPKYLSVHNKDGSKYTGDSVATGMTLRLTVAGEVRQEVAILTRGDANGDGRVSIADYTLMRLHILELKKLTGIYEIAADLNLNGYLTIQDYTIVRLHILGLKPISESYTPFDPGESVDPNNPNDPGYLDTISDPKIRRFLEIALEQQGATYVWGAEGPYSTGFDCSGFVYYCMKNAGYTSIYRTTARAYADYDRDHDDPSTWRWPWPFVELDTMKPGDLMFYESDPYDPYRPIGHVGIYLGNGYHIHASSDYEQVIVSRLEGWYSEFLRYARRVNW